MLSRLILNLHSYDDKRKQSQRPVSGLSTLDGRRTPAVEGTAQLTTHFSRYSTWLEQAVHEFGTNLTFSEGDISAFTESLTHEESAGPSRQSTPSVYSSYIAETSCDDDESGYETRDDFLELRPLDDGTDSDSSTSNKKHSHAAWWNDHNPSSPA